ncbi:membrane dipeptidase [Rhodococcus sp. HNM0569]|uniref:dipeptidase n=1 Tax=Rhodococcus sp. HNM0569 TaxID=2716340 RepID=UPI00146B0F4A|nr:membrane dipeptidase [Rhodococcus sp. HNM0569]NLU82699.1 membrane dipeptidase [Rhodococcus sp. HNM0569]
MTDVSLLWDQHACLPLQPDADVGELTRYSRDGPAFVSVNAGYSPHSFADSSRLLDHYRRSIDGHPGMAVAATVHDVARIAESGRIAVAFDLEDSGPLDGDLENLRRFAELGVRTMLPTYNHENRAGGGCLDSYDRGLTAWGRNLVTEMNAVGMVPDGSHCSARTGLDMCDISTGPVVYSHSCMRSVWQHPRNITDEQARACADTGGVVGITGVGIFLGPNTPTLDAMIEHLEYAVELVGAEHVGVSTDFSFDAADFLRESRTNPGLFDDSYTRWGPIQWMPPEVFLRLGTRLRDRGWADADITAVLGGNFCRVAETSW